MKHLFLLSTILFSAPVYAQQDAVVSFNANKACAEIVGIPYASDNFTDKEWEEFQSCLTMMRYFNKKY